MSDPLTDPAATDPAPTDDEPIASIPRRAPLRSRIARPALALGSGALVALAMPPWGFWPLAVVGVVLFEIALGDEMSRRRRFLLGYLFGAGWMYLGMGWMIQLTLPGYIVAGSVYALYHAVAALIAPNGPWRVIGRPAAHTLAEALRFSFPFGGVPLASIGISQVGGPFLGVARIGGVILITWVIMQLGFALGGLAEAAPAFARRVRPQASWSPHGIVGLAVVLIVVVLSFVAPTGQPTGESLSIAAVQGGGEQGTSALEVPSSLVTERHLEATRSIPDDADLDLVLWPENTIDVATFADSDVLAAIAVEAERLDAPIAVGVTEDSADGTQFVNAQVVVAPDGTVSRPLREGSSRAVRRVRPAALVARSARCTGRPDRARCGGGNGPGRRRTPGRHRTRRGHLVGGVLRRPCPRGRASSGPRRSSTRRTDRATPARSCRPSRWRRAGCERWRTAAGSCRRHRPVSRP